MGGESAETVMSLKYQYVHRLKGQLNSQRKGVATALLKKIILYFTNRERERETRQATSKRKFKKIYYRIIRG